MLTSLFGDLGPSSGPDGSKKDGSAASQPGFAATSIMESVATEVNARGQMIDRHSSDLVVTGSPAQAIREHFASTRADLDTATSLITVLDPAGVWAAAVIKALSDAGGRPIERLHLRDHTTLRTLATIERTTIARRQEDTLRVYHADVRAPGRDNAEVPVALMERSQLVTVIIGPLQAHAIDALLESLHAAVLLPTWRCPHLLFLLPPNAVWIANKVDATPWPARLQAHVISESMTGASAVWNAMLGVWNQVKSQPGWDTGANPPLMGMDDFPIKVRELGEAAPSTDAAPAPGAPAVQASDAAARSSPATPGPFAVDTDVPASRGLRAGLDPMRARQALTGMLTLDGLLGCAVVDGTTGLVMAQETRAGPAPVVDMDLAGAACAQLLRAHRQAARAMSLPEQVDEVMTSAGQRQQVIRTVSRHPGLFLVVLLDKQRTNLALARFQLMEVERGLV